MTMAHTIDPDVSMTRVQPVQPLIRHSNIGHYSYEYDKRRRRVKSSQLLFNYYFTLVMLLVGLTTCTVSAREWTIEELQTYTFPYSTTNDRYMAICKAGESLKFDSFRKMHSYLKHTQKFA